jgi:hypothetical protein
MPRAGLQKPGVYTSACALPLFILVYGWCGFFFRSMTLFCRQLATVVASKGVLDPRGAARICMGVDSICVGAGGGRAAVVGISASAVDSLTPLLGSGALALLAGACVGANGGSDGNSVDAAGSSRSARFCQIACTVLPFVNSIMHGSRARCASRSFGTEASKDWSSRMYFQRQSTAWGENQGYMHAL